MSQNQKYLKSGMWYIIGNLLIKGIAFFTLPLFTRLLSTSDFGNFNLFLSYEGIVSVIMGLGIAGTIKTAYFDYKDDYKKYYSSILSLIIIFCVVSDLVVNIILIFIGLDGKGIWSRGLINLLIIYSTSTSLYNIISTNYVIEIEYKKNLGISFLYTISSIIVSIILCLTVFNETRYLGRILGNAIPLILIVFAISVNSIFRNKCTVNKQYWEYALVMGIPLIFHSLSLVIMQQIDKIMVDSFCGSDSNGIYSYACTISNILTIILGSLDNAWAPWFYSNLDQQNYDELKRNNRKLVGMFGFLCIIFSLLSPEMVMVLAPDNYSTSIYSLVPLNISVFVNFMYMFSVNQEYYFKKTKFIAIGTIISAIIDIGLNYLLIPRFGSYIAAYTTLISKLVLFILHWFICRKVDKNRVIELRTLIFSFITVSAVSFLSIILIHNNILSAIRLIFTAAIMTCAIYFARKKGYLRYVKELISKH